MNNRMRKFDIKNNNHRTKRHLTMFIMPQKPKSRVFLFALSGLFLIFTLHTVPYLSSATNAKGEILGEATTAYSNLSSASVNLAASDFSEALRLFVSAQENLLIAKNRLDNFKALQWLVPQAASADKLLNGASYLAAAGEKLTQALSLFDILKVSSKGVETNQINEKISENRKLLYDCLLLLEQASEEFNGVKSIPADYSETLDEAKDQVARLTLILRKLVGLEDLYLNLFNGQKTYLLVFQNYDEIRATGGFIGTYGVLKLTNGSIDRLKIESIYQLDSQITKQIAAPGPFQPHIPKWGIRDANWFADFPSSAEKLLYFFELGSQTADGVLALTPKTFEDLLNLVGPIEMPDYDVVLTAENFQEVVQFKTSEDYDPKLNKPKKLLDDFAPLLLDRLSGLSQDQWFNLLQILENNLKQRHIILYSKEGNAQELIKDLGYSGEVLETDHDYISVINSNLGGTKTDLNMDQAVNLRSKVLSDGSIINTLTIYRKNSDQLPNKNFLRVLVPLGSELISSQGFDDAVINPSTAEGMQADVDLVTWDRGVESNKTRLSGWVTTDPEEESVVTLVYMLPFKVVSDAGYSLLVQKQSGSKPFQFSGEINLGSLKPKWIGRGIEKSGSILHLNSNSNTDDFWGVVVGK